MALSLILPYLYLGSSLEARQEQLLFESGITHILNVKESVLLPDPARFAFLHVPLSDYGETSLEGIMERCCHFIDSARAEKGRVLVHCALGSNRSPTVVIAYLMKTLKRPLLDCYAHVVRCREVTAPHERYFRQLQELDEQLFGTISLEQVEYGSGLKEALREMKRELASLNTSF